MEQNLCLGDSTVCKVKHRKQVITRIREGVREVMRAWTWGGLRSGKEVEKEA
jgi:hypothetical protein